ncbi:hypothetical protein RclHR1_01520010 [Rhizophagus clarus]|uniref:BTB domain-containing protein n=1 Tax=Rhizophagus clarus TaxID=94130 RepID=A0A2Z6QGB6_9GLOM|nr:hypothetical protein RclHR1_01520010 [Rhizophagus clarus]GES78728.1 hypothetical protein GLOIN_2v1473716 [Rhizophagus clarus]
MAAQFFSQLSQNFIGILDDEEYYDITIEVGQDPEVKIFRSHMIILNYRSVHFRRHLSANKKNSDGKLTHIKLPNISPNIFQIILKYIYGGILNLDGIDLIDIINLLVAAESLKLQEIVDYLQSYFIENETNWMNEHFTHLYNIIFQHNSFIELQKFCTDIISKYPEKLFKSLDLTSISEKSLISLIERDDLKIKEIDIWEQVLKWGLAQNPTLLPNPDTWSDDDFKLMENSIKKCLPFINFFYLTSKEFLNKVVPYQKLLNPQLYKDLMNYYLDGDNKIISTVQSERGSNIDSKLIMSKTAAYIASWIDKKENLHPVYRFKPYSSLDNPYEFKLLLRGSRDGFSPESFHELCDNKPKTIIIAKVKGTSEILGGYNPFMWESKDDLTYTETNESFIFSFTFMNLNDVILSRVKNRHQAFSSNVAFCPCFGDDFYIGSNAVGYCDKLNYEKGLRPEKGFFDLEEYEVFQIIKKV